MGINFRHEAKVESRHPIFKSHSQNYLKWEKVHLLEPKN